ncbi:MAG: hypothetical protein M1269_04470 [Chloroflexi bacterium]|nr:hypothetical protein [Chloroflexota bacterium]
MINETGSSVVNVNVPDEWLKVQWSIWEKLLSPGDSDHVMVPFLPDREFESGGIYTLLNFLASRLFGEGTRVLMRMGEGGQAASGLFQVKDGRLREVRGLDFDVLIDFTPSSLFRLFSVSRDLDETSDPGMDVLFLLLEGMLSNPPEIRVECSGEFISMLPEEFLQAVSMLLDSRVQICGKGIVRKTKAFYPNAFRLHIDELPQWMEKLTFRLSRREFFKELSDLITSHIYLEHGRPELDEAQIEEAQRSLSIISEELGRLKEGVPTLSASLSPPFSIREYPADKFLVLFHRLLPLILGDEGTLFIYCGGIDDFTGRYPAVLLLPFKKGWPGEPSVFRSSTPEWVELTAEQDDLPKPFMKIFLEGEEPGSYSLWGIFKSLTENGTSKLGRGWEFFRAGVILEDTLDIIPEDMFSFETVLEDDRLIIETADGRTAVNYEVIYSFLSRLGSLEGPGAFQFLVEGLLKSAQPGRN